ncbi:MAG: CHAT domain-containing protein [Lewinellaceae bacterium]|nr:CHAT domain-containing protein [Lewinellaceae bacterium]
MLIIYQVPIFDFRRFKPDPHFLKVPLWPAPGEREFVRGVGSVVFRRRGGLNNWIGESRICKAQKSIRFLETPEISISRNNRIIHTHLRPAFRRFYFDGIAAGKYEIGLALNSPQGFQVRLSEIEKFVDRLLTCKVEIPIVNHPPETAFLVSAGKKLARQYLHATSRLKTPYQDDEQAIKYGSPTVYVDALGHEQVEFDRPCEVLPPQDEVKLGQLLLQRQNHTVRIWVADNQSPEEQRSRNLRISVLRLDLALQCLPKLFKEIVTGNINPERGSDESELLQRFLLISDRRILGFSREFDDQIIKKAKEVYDQINPGERIVLREKLDQDIDIRKTIFRKMEDYADTITREKEEKPAARRILFIGANPLNTTRAQITQELSVIREKVQAGKDRDHIRLLFPELAATPERFQNLLRDEDPNIVHFSGHGQEDGIYLEGENGEGILVREEALSELFSLFSESIECVVLNACLSEPQARAIARHIPYVIGMNKKITPDAAIKFSTGFYGAIAAGEPVPRAFELGKNLLNLNDLPDRAVPQLIAAG